MNYLVKMIEHDTGEVFEDVLKLKIMKLIK